MNALKASSKAAVVVLVALLAGCGGGGGADGGDGTNGANGATGPTGADGSPGPKGDPGTIGPTGATGPQGLPGAAGDGGPSSSGADALLIIDAAAVDQPGVTADTDVWVRFSRNPAAAALTNASLTFQRSFRRATRLVSTTVGVECPGGTCYSADAGTHVVNLFGDLPGTDYLETGASFVLLFDADLENDAADRLGAWISSELHTTNAFDVKPVVLSGVFPNQVLSRRAFSFTAKVRVAIAQFDATGQNVGRTLTLPAYTVVDLNGNGNEMSVLVLIDDAGANSQAEPKGLPFTEASIIFDALPENGAFAAGSVVRLCFDQPMDKLSTELAIETRLSAMPNWTNGTGAKKIKVLQALGQPSCFDVTVQVTAVVDIMPIGRVDTLTLLPWDVTSAVGITNTTAPIVFNLFEAHSPTILPVPGKPVADTLNIRLLGGYPTTRPDNDTLIPGDSLEVLFSEPMNVATVQAELAAKFSGLTAGVLPVNILNLGANNFGYTVQVGKTISAAAATLTLGALNTTGTGAVLDAHSVPLAEVQVPIATKADFMVPPMLVAIPSGSPGAGDTMTVVLGPTSKREDNVLSAGDTLVFTFSKSMRLDRIQAVLAARIGTGGVVGATRSAGFPVVAPATVYAGTTVVPNDTFSYTLAGTQSFILSGPTFSFDALTETATVLITDIEGLHLLPNQVPRATVARIDPPVPPRLLTVTGQHFGGTLTPCGDGALGRGDTLTFTFSEPLRVTAVTAVMADIAAKVTAALTAGTVASGNITMAGAVFTVTLPLNAVLTTATPRAFVLDPLNVFDASDVPAADAAAVTASLAATDVLDVSLTLGTHSMKGDGRFEAGDQVLVTFSCVMDRFTTLSAVQEAVDTLMNNGTAKVTTLGAGAQRIYTVEVLPGHWFAAPSTVTLSIANVVTDNLVALTPVAGPFTLPFDDVPTPAVTFAAVPSTLANDHVLFRATAPVPTGTWFMSGMSPSLARVRADLPIVFSDFN
jgi:hypothetical protein